MLFYLVLASTVFQKKSGQPAEKVIRRRGKRLVKSFKKMRNLGRTLKNIIRDVRVI